MTRPRSGGDRAGHAGRPRPTRRDIEWPGDTPTLEPPASFLSACASFGVTFDEGEPERLGRLLGMLLSASEVVNLTAIRDPAEAWHRHVFDALTLLPMLAEVDDGGSVADVGSGGGVPGLVLAVVQPRLRFVLIEATGKKASYLRWASSRLGLGHVAVMEARAEDAGAHPRGPERGRHDVVTARAVGPVSVVSELAVPLARTGGRVLLVKGERADEEVASAKAALHLLHAAHAGTVATPTGRVVVLEKLRATPAAYPRRPGEPKRAPLG